jgi:hypothetical protein
MNKIIIGLVLLVLVGCGPTMLKTNNYDEFRNEVIGKGANFTAESRSQTSRSVWGAGASIPRLGMGYSTQEQANKVALDICSKLASDCIITKENNEVINLTKWEVEEREHAALLVIRDKEIKKDSHLEKSKASSSKTISTKIEVQSESKFEKKCEGNIFSKGYKKGTTEFKDCLKREEKLAALDEQKIGLLNEEKNKQLALVEEKKKKEIEEKNKKKEDLAKAEEERIQKKNTITFSDGSKYVGKLKNGISYGYGKFTDFDGEVCEGEWDSHRTGKNITCVWPEDSKWNGDKYIGMLKNSKRNGTGTYTWRNGNNYVGQWKDGQRNGKGIFSYNSGDKYIGEFENGKRTTGTLKWTDGNVYIGEFNSEGKRHGSGVAFFNDGEKFFVEHDDGKLTSSSYAGNLTLSFDGYILDNNRSYNSSSSSKPRLYYDKANGGMKECSYDPGVFGNCLTFKPYNSNAYSKETLFYNKKTNTHQPCIGAVTGLGQCTAFGLYNSSSASKDQLFYDPKNNKMTTCLHVSVSGECQHYSLVAKTPYTGFRSQSETNPYHFRVPETSDQLMQQGLNMLGGGCRLGRNC